MPIARLSELTWEDVAALVGEETVAILPLGATEAHGPHLPLATDSIISGAMAEDAAVRLDQAGWSVLLLPPLEYTAAPFAAGFPGTLSVRPEAVTGIVVDLGTGLRASGFERLAIANAHLDPTHLESIHRAVEELRAGGSRVAFPDLTRKPWAPRLTAEFQSGACHAGRFEGSIVLAARPELVRNEVRETLEPNPSSLSLAIRAGKTSFREAGGDRAYFGDPALATPEEGRTTISELGRILCDAIFEAEGRDPGAS